MAKWLSANVLDGGLNVLDASANECRLVSGYTLGDDYATIVTNTVAVWTLQAGDIVLADGANSARQAEVAALTGATATADSGATPDLHVAVCVAGTRVDAVTDEVTDQVVTTGDTVNLSAFNIIMNQPSQV